MGHQCLYGIGTAAGREPAGRRQGWRDPPAVEPQYAHQQPNHRASRTTRTRQTSRTGRKRYASHRGQDSHLRPPRLGTLAPLTVREPTRRRNAPSRSSPSAALLAPADAGSARTTTSAPAGRAATRCRMRCRSRRCTRCRTTEPPTVRATTKPTFVPISTGRPSSTGGEPASPALARARCTTTEPQAARRPRRTAVAKSSRRVSRVGAESNAKYPRKYARNANASPQADSSMRPLRRRAARMARPARVRMRNRNPWVLARRRLFGWNVRLPLLTASFSRCLVLGSHRGVAAVGTADSRVVPYRHGRHCAQNSPGTRTTYRSVGEGTRECPQVGGRRPDPRPPVPAASKPASRVTTQATRRYIEGACLPGVLVAAPQALPAGKA